MPRQGEQHNYAATNPFEEVKPHVSEYTAAEIATLSSRLEKQLGPEYISSRVGPGGGKVHYLAADKCINLANDVFGFNGWSSSIQNIQIDFVDETDQGRVSLGLSVTLRVSLRDGTYHEDIGYGHIENCKGKAAAFEKAKKEGTTDALKRALRNFGNLLGNCVYDKEYVAKVTKLKAGPTKWDPDSLHRHPDFAPIRKEPGSDSLRPHPSLPWVKQEVPAAGLNETQLASIGAGEDEFGSDDFDAVDFSVPSGDHPDKTIMDANLSSEQKTRETRLPQKRSPSKSAIADPGGSGPQTPNSQQLFRPPPPLFQQTSNALIASAATAQLPQSHSTLMNHTASDIPSSNLSNTSGHDPPVGFFTARAAETLQNGCKSTVKAPLFNPHLESPSIRKTAGIDHTKTKPVNRETLVQPTPPPSSSTIAGPPARSSFVNPQADKMRKVGMPVGPGSPLQNRGSYKPPQMKRPAEGNPLRDVTAASVNAGEVLEAKRQKLMVGGTGQGNDALDA